MLILAGQITTAEYSNYEPVVDSLFHTAAAIVYIDPKVTTNGVEVRTPSVASLLLRKEVWQAVGGFPEALRAAEDSVFKDQIRIQGFRSVWAPQAVIYWELPTGLTPLFRKFVNYSRFSLQAGHFRRWHRAVLRLYLVLLVAALGGQLSLHNMVVTSLLFPLFYVARALKHLKSKPEFVGNPLSLGVKLPLVAFIQLLIDGAMLVGIIQWAADKLHGVDYSD